MAILTVICDINAKMNNADSSTHFSSLRLAESVSEKLITTFSDPKNGKSSMFENTWKIHFYYYGLIMTE